MAHFSRWLGETRALPQSGRSCHRCEVPWDPEGLRATRSSCRSGRLRLMIEYLRDLGLVAPEAPRALTPVEVLLGELARYLIDERGLASESVRSYVGVARQFLAHTRGGDDLDFEDLNASVVLYFVRDECARRGVGSASATVTGTRAWLRFLHRTGRTPMSLVRGGAVGGELVAGRLAPRHRHCRVGAPAWKL